MPIGVTNLGTGASAGPTTTVSATVNKNVNIGDLIFVVTNENNTTAAGLLGDSSGNTYTKQSSVANNGVNADGWAAIWTCVAGASLASGVSTITYTLNTPGGSASLGTARVTGQAAITPVDAATIANATGTTPTQPTITSGTPGASRELFIGACAMQGGSPTAWTNDPTYSSPLGQVTPTTSGGVIMGFENAGTVNPGSGTMTYSVTTSPTILPWSAFILGIKPGAGGGLSATSFGTIFG